MFTRRDGLKLALAAAAAAAGTRPGLVLPARAEAGTVFKVPPLGYGFDALEPYIDTATMMIHHDRHHGAYVAALNGLLEKYPDLATKTPVAILADLSMVPEAVRAPVRNNLGGHWNHSFFWELMTPGGAKEPSRDLKSAIDSSFGSAAKLTGKVNAAGLSRFGSGWAWLIVDKNGKLDVVSTPNQDTPLEKGVQRVVLGVDVWEHAYYLKYQNNRADYLAAWWNTVNWDRAAANFATGLTGGRIISVASFFSYAGAVWWSMATAFFCTTLGLGLVQPFVQRRRATRKDRPLISAIIPIKLLDPGFATAQASMFAQDYPAYEVLIGAAEQDSPALDAAHRIAASHPEVSCRFLRSAGTAAVSPKLNNLATPLATASHDLVFTKDSNITLDPGAMAAFVQNFTQGVGLVVGVPVAVRARNFAGRIEAFSINGHARLLLTASALGVGFGVGKAMLFRRSDLAKAGGIAAISDTLAEDTAISIVLARQGLKTVFSHRTTAQEIGARTFREIYERQLRWSIVRRKHERVTFPLEPLASPLPAAVAGALAAPLVSYPAWLGFSLTLLLWFCAEAGFALCKGWGEVSRWSPLTFLGREILALVAWLRAFTTHDVVWAQVRFDARQGVRAPECEPAAFLRHEAGDRRDSG